MQLRHALSWQGEAVLGVSKPMGSLGLDLPETRSSSDVGLSGSGAYDPVAGLAARVERNLSHDSLHNSSSELSLPTGLPHPTLGSP